VWGDTVVYSCLAEISASFAEVEDAIDLVEYYFDMELNEDWYMDDVLSMGARVYAEYEATDFTTRGDTTEGQLSVWFPYVEALDGLNKAEQDFGDFENLFEDTEQTKFDLMSE